MTHAQRGRKAIHSWRDEKPLLEHWREDLKTVSIELKQPRVIDAVPMNFVSGEPVEREGKATTTFRGRLIYFTNADLTIRRPSGAILVIDRYETITISDGKKRLEPR
jgi:hypothetical protein